MKTIVFFNNKGGVGKTTLVYHLAWMFSELEYKTVAVDLDPQSNLSTAFLPEDRLAELWPDEEHSLTILGAVDPLLQRLGDLNAPHVEPITEHLGLVVGDLGLSMFEDRLAESWARCLDDNQATSADAFRVTSAFYRAMESAARQRDADFALIDVGPNLGAINRSALVAADFVVVPLGADLFSIQGLRNLGPALQAWRRGWRKRLDETPPSGLVLPSGSIEPIGYILIPPSTRKDRPVKAYQRWADRIPENYVSHVLGGSDDSGNVDVNDNMLATIKHYKSLMPLAQDARKPMFLLKSADGAIGGHMSAVKGCYDDFESLARIIVSRCQGG